MAYLDKRGVVGLATIMFIIIALVSFGAVASIGLKAAETSGKVAEGVTCKASLAAQTITSEISLGLAESSNVCETISHEIRVSQGDEYELMYFMANKMARSYWIVNEGEFLNRDLWQRDGFTPGWKCLIMYAINVKQKGRVLGQAQPIEISREQFVDFLKETPYPPKKDKTITYAKYFFENRNMYFDVLPNFPPNILDGLAYTEDFVEEISFSNFFLTEILLSVTKDSDKNAIHSEGSIKTDETYAITVCSHDKGFTIPGFDTSHNTDLQLFLTTMKYAENEMGALYI